MSKTKIMPHHCEHATQDKMHGKGMRVFNAQKSSPPVQDWTCTVCAGAVRKGAE